MKTIYIILSDGFPEFAFTDKKKALKQLQVIKHDIENGCYFVGNGDDGLYYLPASAYKFEPDFSDNERICFKDTKKGIFLNYYIREVDLNSGYKL